MSAARLRKYTILGGDGSAVAWQTEAKIGLAPRGFAAIDGGVLNRTHKASLFDVQETPFYSD
jgi:hypothetical protein